MIRRVMETVAITTTIIASNSGASWVWYESYIRSSKMAVWISKKSASTTSTFLYQGKWLIQGQSMQLPGQFFLKSSNGHT